MKKILSEFIEGFFYTLVAIVLFCIALVLAGPPVICGALIYVFGKIIRNRYTKLYGINIAYSGDQLAGTIWLGDPDETISSRLGRSIGDERFWWVKGFRVSVDFVAKYVFDDPDHSKNSVKEKEQKALRHENDREILRLNKTKIMLS